MSISCYARGVSFAALILTVPAVAKADPVGFDLPAQPLAASVKAVASAEGLTLAVNDDLLAGKTAPALKGKFEADDALRRVLQGSGLGVTVTGRVAEITALQGEVMLAPVRVGAAKDGGAEAGYRVDTLRSVGPLGARDVLDTPYSMTVLPQDLIENVQAPSPDLVIQMNPFSQLSVPTARGYNVTEYIRGFSAMQMYDGNRETLVAYEDVEDKDRVEVLNGLSGLLNGGASATTTLPGGTVNYILKRPTDTPFADVTAGVYDTTVPFTHLDIGGPVGDKIGYRFNAVVESGNTAVDQQNLSHYLLSGAVDAHLADTVLLQFDLSDSYRKWNGLDALWGTASAKIPFPSAPSASKNYGQPWTFWETALLHAGTNLTWDAGDALTIRTSFRFGERDSKDLYENNTFQANGTYSEGLSYSAPGLSNLYEGYAYADYKAATFGIDHKITFGYSIDRTVSYSAIVPFQSVASLTGLSVAAPLAVAEYPWHDLRRQKSSDATNESLVLADAVTIDDQWSLMVGINDAHLLSESFNYQTSDSLASAYNRSDVTPSGSVIFKPLPWLSTYATYMQGLEPGGGPAAVSATGTNGTRPVSNAGALLAPIVDTEYEVGAKAQVGDSLLTLALFDITRPSDIYLPDGPVSYTYTEEGSEEHKGVELGISGKVTANLTLWGGVTLMDAQITRNANNPALVGTRPAGVSDRLVKLYAEYAVDQVPGLTLTGGVIYAGNYYATAGNVGLLPSYVVGNLGVRYEAEFYRTPTVFRLNVDNVANSNYWLAPGYEGDPRAIMGSVEVKF